MRRAFLLYNPESGRRQHRRLADARSAATALESLQIQVTMAATTAPGSAAEQVRQAIATGHDAVIIAGGDGTVNEVLPAVVGAQVAVGVIPLGTANGLANDLGLPHHPAKAAELVGTATPRAVALPQMEYTDSAGRRLSRYWIMGAGIGADAYMVYRLTLAFKKRWGYTAYYTETMRQWLTHPFPLFTAEFRDRSGQWRRERVSQVLAIRIAWFGGLLKRLAPGAALSNSDFQLVLFKTQNRMSYLRYMMGVWTNRPYSRPDIDVVPATHCRCFEPDDLPANTVRTYAETDGELLGTLPVSISMSDEFVNLLVPRTAAGKFAVL